MSEPQVEWKLSQPNLEVVAVEQGYSAHPNPSKNGKLVPFTGLSKLLLSDGTETYGCNECGYTNDNPKSVIAHMVTHSERSKSFYSDETLLIVVKMVLQYKRQKIRSYCEAAAAELTRRQIPDYAGETTWTATKVSSIFNAHEKRILEWDLERRKQRVTQHAEERKQRPPTTVSSTGVMQRTAVTLNQLAEQLLETGQALKLLARDVETNHGNVSSAELAMLRDKAKKFDQLKGLMK